MCTCVYIYSIASYMCIHIYIYIYHIVHIYIYIYIYIYMCIYIYIYHIVHRSLSLSLYVCMYICIYIYIYVYVYIYIYTRIYYLVVAIIRYDRRSGAARPRSSSEQSGERAERPRLLEATTLTTVMFFFSRVSLMVVSTHSLTTVIIMSYVYP